jgi:FkbM family methyltransferase
MSVGEVSLNSKRLPLYQAVIRKLPFKRSAAARAMGFLFGPGIAAQVNHFSMKLDLRESIQRLMFLDMYEPEQTAWFKQCLRSGDTFVDVGASFGYYTTLASTLVGLSGRVFAFEPSPLASKVIEETIVDAAIQNVTLTKAAVGGRSGGAVLFLPTTRYLHSPSILQSDPEFVPLEIAVVALDQFEPLEDVPRIKLVKIDVEGYEPDVLEGMANLIKAGRVENIICEFNSGWLHRNSTTAKQLLERFMDLGYKIRMQTKLQENLKGHHGELFNLQDIWFSIA